MKKKLWKDEEKRDSVYRDLAAINSIKPELKGDIDIVNAFNKNKFFKSLPDMKNEE